MAVAALCAAAHPAMAGQALSTTTKHSPIAKGDSYWWNSVTGETSLTDPSFVLKGHSDEQGNVVRSEQRRPPCEEYKVNIHFYFFWVAKNKANGSNFSHLPLFTR